MRNHKWIATVTALLILLSGLLKSQIPLLLALILFGPYLLWIIAKELFAGDVGADLLAAISIIASVAMNEYLVAGIVILMLSGGRALEDYATQKAFHALEAVAKRSPRTAHLLESGSERLIQASEIRPNQMVRIFPHEICPIDGIVTEGRGSMDESYLTGEPYLISKTTGSSVLSGAINGNTILTIRAIHATSDSRFAQIVKVMQSSQQSRPKLRRIGDRLGRWYAPFALTIATFAWLISGIPERFLAVLVIATPCPLILAIPIAIIGAVSTAARRSIIIKDPKGLEQVGECRTFIFDKTGTLTYGRPNLTEIETAPEFGSAEVLAAAASLETYSKHPLASAVLTAAKKRSLEVAQASDVSEVPGHGLRGVVSGKKIVITGRSKIDLSRVPLPPTQSGLECIVLIDDKFSGILHFRDTPREEGPAFIRHLDPKHGAKKTILLSGDRGPEVKYLADLLGIRDIYFEKTPEQKVEIVKQETSEQKTLYLGDGINDAPALMLATVGVAFGNGSDITAEAADAVILEASLRKVDEFIHIGKRMRTIALQSAIGGMTLSLGGMLFATFGWLSPVEGVIAQELIDVLAILNALRVAFPPKRLADF